jgi:hypothetical protein
MNRRSIVAVVVLALVTAGACCADTLVITYRSGKTQTFILDEPSTTINSWQFVEGAPVARQPQPPAQQQGIHGAPASVPVDEGSKSAEKPAEKKPAPRFQWNAKPIPD